MSEQELLKKGDIVVDRLGGRPWPESGRMVRCFIVVSDPHVRYGFDDVPENLVVDIVTSEGIAVSDRWSASSRDYDGEWDIIR